MPNTPQDEIDRWLLLAKTEGWSIDVFYHRVKHWFNEGPSESISWAESVWAGLAAVLSLSPGHEGATSLMRLVESDLLRIGEEAERMFQLAESKFKSGDLKGCIDFLRLTTGLKIRHRQAEDLLDRIEEKARAWARDDPQITEPKWLLQKVEFLRSRWRQRL